MNMTTLRSSVAISTLVLAAFAACDDDRRRSSRDDDDDGSGGSFVSSSSGTGIGGGVTSTGVGGGSTTTTGTGGGIPPTPCENAIDCGTVGSVVCDPKTLTCSLPGCDPDLQNCPGGDHCLIQGPPTYGAGACYAACDPAAGGTGCGTGETCRDLLFDEVYGACFKVASAQKGQSCESTDTSTGCAAGLICLSDETSQSSCYDTCDYWEGVGSCPANGEYCDYRGFCVPSMYLTLDPAAIGQNCEAPDPQVFTACGVSGDKLEGACVEVGGVWECLRMCRLNLGHADCPGQACYDVGIDTFGVCAG